MGYTDNGTTMNLAQSPLSANTVFYFFFPSFEFPGALASAGLTTPEFQLTSDTSVALQMNFLEAGILGNGGNTNGLSSYNNGNGAITLDLGPWMTTNYTASAKVPALVDNLTSLLLAGQLSAAAKTNIVNYVTNTVNFPTFLAAHATHKCATASAPSSICSSTRRTSPSRNSAYGRQAIFRAAVTPARLHPPSRVRRARHRCDDLRHPRPAVS